MRKLVCIISGLLLFQGCQIREEISFLEDGSGTYEMSFEMSDLLDMADLADSIPLQPAVDTLVVFASFLDDKKDSIRELSRKEQRKLETLRPLQFEMKSIDSTNGVAMYLTYTFHSISEITRFPEALEIADIQPLNTMLNPIQPTAEGGSDSLKRDDGMDGMFSMAQSFRTSFSRSRFSRKITDKARVEALQKKDTTLKADDSFGDMIQFIQVYRFPFRVKAVSNPNARILPDYKGVEIVADMFQLNQDPEFLDIEVDFRNE